MLKTLLKMLKTPLAISIRRYTPVLNILSYSLEIPIIL